MSGQAKRPSVSAGRWCKDIEALLEPPPFPPPDVDQERTEREPQPRDGR